MHAPPLRGCRLGTYTSSTELLSTSQHNSEYEGSQPLIIHKYTNNNKKLPYWILWIILWQIEWKYKVQLKLETLTLRWQFNQTVVPILGIKSETMHCKNVVYLQARVLNKMWCELTLRSVGAVGPSVGRNLRPYPQESIIYPNFLVHRYCRWNFYHLVHEQNHVNNTCKMVSMNASRACTSTLCTCLRFATN